VILLDKVKPFNLKLLTCTTPAPPALHQMQCGASVAGGTSESSAGASVVSPQ